MGLGTGIGTMSRRAVHSLTSTRAKRRRTPFLVSETHSFMNMGHWGKNKYGHGQPIGPGHSGWMTPERERPGPPRS